MVELCAVRLGPFAPVDDPISVYKHSTPAAAACPPCEDVSCATTDDQAFLVMWIGEADRVDNQVCSYLSVRMPVIVRLVAEAAERADSIEEREYVGMEDISQRQTILRQKSQRRKRAKNYTLTCNSDLPLGR